MGTSVGIKVNFPIVTTPIVDVFVPIEPRPASRPQVSRYGVRYSKHHMEYQHLFKEWLKTTETPWVDIDKQLCMVILSFVSTKARTSKLVTPGYDVDNACKLIMDCITSSKLVWHDDKTVVGVSAFKRFSKGPDDPPGTHLSIFKLED